MEEKSIEYWKDIENMDEYSKKIRNYGRKVSWIVKELGIYRNKYWKDRENMEERSVK